MFDSFKFTIKTIVIAFTAHVSAALAGEMDMKPPINSGLDVLSLMEIARPNYLLSGDSQLFLRHVFCEKLNGNEFERRESVQNISSQVRDRTAILSGVISGVERIFPLREYDFANRSFSLAIGRNDWENYFDVGSLRFGPNEACWQLPPQPYFGAPTPFAFPRVVTVQADWNTIPRKVTVEEQEARSYYIGGAPTALVSMRVKVTAFGVGPLGNPKLILSGPVLAWRISVKNGRGEIVKTLESSVSAETREIRRIQDSSATDQLSIGKWKISGSGMGASASLKTERHKSVSELVYNCKSQNELTLFIKSNPASRYIVIDTGGDINSLPISPKGELPQDAAQVFVNKIIVLEKYTFGNEFIRDGGDPSRRKLEVGLIAVNDNTKLISPEGEDSIDMTGYSPARKILRERCKVKSQ